jgi:methionyl-tRNA formyltransferase
MGPEPLRIVSLNAYPAGFQLVHDFAERNAHEIVLVVTLPHSSRYGRWSWICRSEPTH